MSFLTVIVILVVIEAGLIAIVSLQRRNFPWLITKQDEFPTLDQQALEKFLDYSFDPHLGWVRKPDSSGVENGQKGPVTFHIDSLGSRANPFNKTPPTMAVFGDSYAFCRQVEDGETWEARLAQQQESGVLNFGVGNYGADQALLRYEGLKLPETVQIVVMAFVPETICRIQSYWKHYLEFGNTFAFKPRFALSAEGKLVLLENKIRNAEDFAALREKLPEIRKHDGFYEKKFRSHQFRFPYLLSLLRNPLRQIILICAIAVRSVLRALGVSNRRVENLPFALIMKRNLLDAYRLYGDSESTTLLSAILLRFRQEALHREHNPLVVVIPQLLDLKLNRNKTTPYRHYFAELAQQMPVLDLTNKFADAGFEKLYIDDQYGGHLSAEGNLLVAEAISAWLASRQKPQHQ